MEKNLQMDWIDGLLVSFSFGCIIGISILFPTFGRWTQEYSLILIFTLPVFRRKFYGSPNLPPPKESTGAKLISVLGLLILFFSLPLFYITSLAIQDSLKPIPYFRSEVEAYETEMNAQFAEMDSFLNAVVVPADTPQEVIDQLTEEKIKENQQKQSERIENEIQRKTLRFKEDQEERFTDGLTFLKWGIGFSILGSLCLRYRYPFVKEKDNKLSSTSE